MYYLSLPLIFGAVLPESHTTGVTARLALRKDGIHILEQNDGLFRSLVQPRVERCVMQPAHKKQQQEAKTGGVCHVGVDVGSDMQHTICWIESRRRWRS